MAERIMLTFDRWGRAKRAYAVKTAIKGKHFNRPMSMVLAVEGFDRVLWVGVCRRTYYSTASTFFTTSFASGFLSGSAFCPLMSTTIGGFLSVMPANPRATARIPTLYPLFPRPYHDYDGVASSINLRENQLRCQ